MLSKIKLSYNLMGSGSASATISNETDTATLYISYLSDPLFTLINAIMNLLQLSRQAECIWKDEPGEYHWLFERDGEILAITILWFSEGFYQFDKQELLHKSNKDGEVVFSAECNFLRFAIQVRGLLKQILAAYGLEEYKNQWGYDFPLTEYNKLNALIRQKQLEQKAIL